MKGNTRFATRPLIKVMIVEDEPMFRRLLIGMLRSLPNVDFEFEECVDGSDALTKFRGGSKPDLIITDYDMQPLDGICFTRAVRAGDEGADRLVPIIMVSGDKTHDVLRSSILAGVDGYLHKPVPPETLRKQILQVLSRDTHFVEVQRAEGGRWFGPLSPFVKKNVLGAHPHSLHHRPRRFAA